jgi:ribonuclease HI
MNNRIALSIKPDFTAGRWDWSLAGEGFSLTGAVEAQDREDAVVCALDMAHADLAAHGPATIVLSLVESARLWSFTADLETLFGGLTLTPYTDADCELRSAAIAALKPAPAEPGPLPALTVATDGSSHHGRIGWGWLAHDGQHGQGSRKPTRGECARRSHVVLAELRAISAAISALPDRPLQIRSDSTAAIALVDEWMRGGDRLPQGYVTTHPLATRKGGLLCMQEQVRTHRHRIDISWVRGHVGDALNEGADSLAKLARRAAEGTWGFTTDDVDRRAHEIADAFATHRRSLATAA